MFSDFGDFNVFKDSHKSCYIEFFTYEQSKIASLDDFVRILNENKEKFGIKEAFLYKDA